MTLDQELTRFYKEFGVYKSRPIPAAVNPNRMSADQSLQNKQHMASLAQT